LRTGPLRRAFLVRGGVLLGEPFRPTEG
jgi:hypothetical protein